jgi:hypothetical protein
MTRRMSLGFPKTVGGWEVGDKGNSNPALFRAIAKNTLQPISFLNPDR